MTDPPIRVPPGQAHPANNRFAELEAQARHASERYRLYRAKVYGPRSSSLTRLRKLERESKLAERRLQGARIALAP